MATSEIAKTRLKIKAIADGTTGLTAARNVLGLHDLAEPDTFLDTLVSDGPFLSIRPARMTGRDQTTGSNKFEVDCYMYFGFANNSEYDWTAIEDVLFTSTTGLLARLGTTSNWRPGDATDASIPQNIDFSGDPECKTTNSPILAWYKWTFHFVGC